MSAEKFEENFMTPEERALAKADATAETKTFLEYAETAKEIRELSDAMNDFKNDVPHLERLETVLEKIRIRDSGRRLDLSKQVGMDVTFFGGEDHVPSTGEEVDYSLPARIKRIRAQAGATLAELVKIEGELSYIIQETDRSKNPEKFLPENQN